MRDIYVLIRPYIDEFLKRVSICYEEIIVFTASLAKYANPIIDYIDKHKVIKYRLFREQCTWVNNTFVKELKRLNRNMKKVVILDNNPYSFCLDPDNGIPINSFYDDKNDKELIQMAYVLEKLSKVNDVRPVINEIIYLNQINYDKAFQLFKHKNEDQENIDEDNDKNKDKTNDQDKKAINNLNTQQSKKMKIVEVKPHKENSTIKKVNKKTPTKIESKLEFKETEININDNDVKNNSSLKKQFNNKKQVKTKTGAIAPVTNITLKDFSTSRKFYKSCNGTITGGGEELQKLIINNHNHNHNQMLKINLFKTTDNGAKYAVITSKNKQKDKIKQTKDKQKKQEKQFENKKISKSLTYTSLHTIKQSNSKPKMSSAKSNSNIRKPIGLAGNITPKTDKRLSNKVKAKNITIRAIEAQSFLNKENSPKTHTHSTKYQSKTNNKTISSINHTCHIGKVKNLNSNNKKENNRYCTSMYFYQDKRSIINTTTTSFRSNNMNVSNTLKESNDYHSKKNKELNKTPSNKKIEKPLFYSSATKKLKILQIIPNIAKISLNRSKTFLNCSFQNGQKKNI